MKNSSTQLKNLCVLLLLATAFVVVQSCEDATSKKETANTRLPRISVEGNTFVLPDGKPVVFRGYNTSDPDKLEKDGHWNQEYFNELKEWGATLIRFPVHPAAWRERGEATYLSLLDKGISMAEGLGMYVVIDWHSIGNLKDEKFFKPGYVTTMEETKAFWKTMAERYKDNTTVAFFELFNEPTVYEGTLGACSWDEWKLIMEDIIGLIRENGCETIPLVAGFNWAYDLTPLRTAPIAAEGIGYISHPYPQKREKPWEEKWTEDWGFAAENYPIILSEMGFCGPDDRGAHEPVISDESYGDAITKYADKHGISYLVWVFDPDWSPMAFNDWSFTPSRQGTYFKKVIQSY